MPLKAEEAADLEFFESRIRPLLVDACLDCHGEKKQKGDLRLDSREAALKGADLILAPAGWRYPWGRQYELACAARALDNAVYLASANQLGDYPEAGFDTPGGVYGPDGLRVCELTSSHSVARVDLGLPDRWRKSFGSTLPAPAETPASRIELSTFSG